MLPFNNSVGILEGILIIVMLLTVLVLIVYLIIQAFKSNKYLLKVGDYVKGISNDDYPKSRCEWEGKIIEVGDRVYYIYGSYTLSDGVTYTHQRFTIVKTDKIQLISCGKQ